mmetsp:Transcript_31553/g.47691  ORF Transcript_31553/g.47691 Transcript_31553/m.47691 type:complete len:609 (-) Transcript_31553:1564-3390(-)
MMATNNHSPTPSLTMVRSLPQGVDELSSMGPFELFQSQLEHGSTEAKVDGMKRLSVVAYALGTEITLSSLIPYLTNVAMKQPPHEDEILLIMASQLQLLVPDLLSTNPQVLPLIPILERLSTMEETVVRDEAVKAVNHVAPYITDFTQLTSMVKRLVAADWFTAKVSAAGMCPKLFEVTNEDDLRFVYRDLCQDDTPMVRRAAAKNLGSFLSQLSFEKVQELQPILEHLCGDEQDSVRLLAIASLSQIGAKFKPDWTTQVLLPLVKQGSTDLSWRVRHHLAKSFSDVAVSLNLNENYPTQRKLVMSCFVALLQDQEGEVRAGAVGHLAQMVHWGGAPLFSSHLQALLPALADDVVVDVRSKCALALMDASEGGTLPDDMIVRSFTPLLENFLQDEYSEVQLHVLNNLSRISHLLNQMPDVVSNIISMSKATNWRVREGVAQLLPHLAEARGMDFFSSVLQEPAWMALLLDQVCDVRYACVGGVSKLCLVAGDDWIVQSLLPQHIKIYELSSNAYLMRMTILRAHAEMATASKTGHLFFQVIDQLLRGTDDKVANVRMVATKGLLKVIKNGECDKDVIVSKVKPALEQALASEEDIDCQYLFTECLNAC